LLCFIALAELIISTQEKHDRQKLCKINGLIIGGSGAAESTGLFMLFCKTRKPTSATEHDIIEFLVEFQEWATKRINTFKLDDCTYLLVFNKKAFQIYGLYVSEIEKYKAIGSGGDFALAALYLGKSVKESVKAACHLSIYCEQPINIYEVRK